MGGAGSGPTMPSHVNSNKLLMKSQSGCNCGNPGCVDAAAPSQMNSFSAPGATASSYHQSGSPCLGGAEIQCSTVSSQQLSPRPCSRTGGLGASHHNMPIPHAHQQQPAHQRHGN